MRAKVAALLLLSVASSAHSAGEPNYLRRPAAGGVAEYGAIQVAHIVGLTPAAIGAATAAQGSLAASAVQPSALASGSITPAVGALDLRLVGSALQSESDPAWTASASHGITSTQVSHWDAAYGWGSHAAAGYLTSASLAGGAITPAPGALDLRYLPSSELGTAAYTASAAYEAAGGSESLRSEWIEWALSPVGGIVVAGDALYADMPFSATAAKFRVACQAAPTASAMTVDLRRNAAWGSTPASILSATLSLSAGSYEASTASFGAPSLTADDVLSVVIVSTDSGATAAGCVATLSLVRSTQ